MLGGALIFSYLGARANAMVNAQALTLIVALLVVFAGAYILLPAPRENAAHRDGRTRAQQLLLVIVGALAGFGSGLSGAGGPLFSVPMMLVLGFAPLAVIGASQVLQIVAALAGTVGNLQFGSIDFTLAGWISLFELAGGLGKHALGVIDAPDVAENGRVGPRRPAEHREGVVQFSQRVVRGAKIED
ncbi:MAG: sulfite exporter TauE/SafE family protein, partial [Burkholderiales bacterium]|nr:sulfite exporter TauE/SafE family protein [Burkholderiales bacterium]